MLARTLPFSSSSDPAVQGHLRRWLSSGAPFGDLGDKASLGLLFALCVWITLVALFAFEGVRRKSCSLFLSGALSSAILGAACFGGATLILPAVDGALRPALAASGAQLARRRLDARRAAWRARSTEQPRAGRTCSPRV
jgi:hypothetical protein